MGEDFQPREHADPEAWFRASSLLDKKRWAIKAFHPDAADSHYQTAEDAYDVIGVIGKLKNLDDERYWPAVFYDTQTLRRVTLPGAGKPETRTIFLPRTPLEFLWILFKFKTHGGVNVSDYPLVPLETIDGTRTTSDEEEEEIDPRAEEIGRLVNRIRKTTKLEDLKSYFTTRPIHRTYPVELLETCQLADGSQVKILEEISAQAKVLFEKRARFTTTPEKLADFAKDAAEFYFLKVLYSTEHRGQPKLVWDDAVRNEVISLVADTYVKRIQKAKKAEEVNQILRTLPNKPVLEPVRAVAEAEALKKKGEFSWL